MKKNLSIFGLFTAILLALNVSSASADPTYAVLDANGNVTNIIVCGSACAGGTFAGQTVVPQIAAGPNGENRGGLWGGPGTTTYDSNTGVFTAQIAAPIFSNHVDVEYDELMNKTETKLETVVYGSTQTIKYEDTLNSTVSSATKYLEPKENTKSKISVSKNQYEESIIFDNRKNSTEISQQVVIQNMSLIIAKINKLILLLGNWVK